MRLSKCQVQANVSSRLDIEQKWVVDSSFNTKSLVVDMLMRCGDKNRDSLTGQFPEPSS